MNQGQRKYLNMNSIPFKANILVLGFISAESAVIGLLKGCIGIFISIITTEFCGEVSRMHIYLSDSMVTLVNVMNCGLIPMLVNCNSTSKHKTISTQLIFKSHILKYNTRKELKRQKNFASNYILKTTDLKANKARQI